jgi:hypothetical protein
VIWKPEAAAQPAVKSRRGALPSAREAAAEAKPGKGRAPRVVKVVKPSEIPMRKPKPKAVVVRGNERVTQGGNIKRAKKRQASAKRSHQSSK